MTFPYACHTRMGRQHSTHKPESPTDIRTSICQRCNKFIIRRAVKRGSIPADNVWGWAATILIKEWP